jgi:hypothetical protein
VVTVVSRQAYRDSPDMGADEPRQLALEVKFDTVPIEGRLYDQTDRNRLDRSFSGWLGLMSAIEAARGDDSPGGRTHGHRSHGGGCTRWRKA